jgi:hypothetical protein
MVDGWMDNGRGIHRWLGTCVDFGDWVQSEALLFLLLLLYIAVTNSGGCRHVISYCVVWLSCSTFLSDYQVFRTACLCLKRISKAAIRT